MLTRFQVNAAPATASPSIVSQPQGVTVGTGNNVAFSVYRLRIFATCLSVELNGSPLLNATNATLLLAERAARTIGGLYRHRDQSVRSVHEPGGDFDRAASPCQRARCAFAAGHGDLLAVCFWQFQHRPHRGQQCAGVSRVEHLSQSRCKTAAFETVNDLGFNNGTRLTFTLSHNHNDPFPQNLGRFRFSLTTDPRDTFADGLISGGDVTANWTVLDPISFSAVNGTTLTELPDHSILASGDHPVNDTYTVTLFTAATGITGFRLEVLEDPSLPHTGPGRDSRNGNFILTRFQVNAASATASPSIVSQPQGTGVFSETTAMLNVTAIGSLPLSYQWNFNGSPVSNATNSVLTFNNIQTEQSGDYTVIVTNQFGSVTSVVATLTVLPVPANGQDVALQQATATFSQSAFGNFSIAHTVGSNAPVSPGWSIYPNLVAQTAAFETVNDLGFNNGTRLTFTLSHNDPFPQNLGRFRLSVTTDARDTFADGLISGGDVTANWTVLDPISLSTAYGTILTELPDHSILASGVQPTNDTYTVTVFTAATGITGFRLEVLEDPSLPFNGPGRDSRNGNFMLTRFQVNAAPATASPSIVSQPQGVTVGTGTNVAFSVTALGSLPLAYQWSLNGSPLLNATNATLLLANVQPEQSGDYTVIVTNQFGSRHEPGRDFDGLRHTHFSLASAIAIARRHPCANSNYADKYGRRCRYDLPRSVRR